MREEYASGYVTAATRVLGKNGGRERVDGLAIGDGFAVVKEQVAVPGLAENFGRTGDVIADLLE